MSQIEKNLFDSYRDQIEYAGTRLVNANRTGKCAWCGSDTVWFDMNARVFLCSEQCEDNWWGQYMDMKLR